MLGTLDISFYCKTSDKHSENIHDKNERKEYSLNIYKTIPISLISHTWLEKTLKGRFDRFCK